MEYYACNDPDCNFKTNNWGKLKSHLIKKHVMEDLKDAKKDAFVDFSITQDEFKGIQQSTSGIVNNEITSYSDDPTTRLKEVLEVNLGESPEIIKKVCRVFTLSPWLEQDLPGLERMLTAHFGTGKKLLIQNCLSQYSRSQYNSFQSDELSGSGMMTIYDSNNNPMRLPVDKGLIEAIRNKTIAETEFVKMQQLHEMGNSGNERISILEKENADLKQKFNDEKLAGMQKQIVELKDMLAHPADSKGVLDVAAEAGTDMKELLFAAGKEVKSTLEDGLSNIAQAVNKGKISSTDVFGDGISRTTEQIIAIMETENDLLEALPPDGQFPQRQHHG